MGFAEVATPRMTSHSGTLGANSLWSAIPPGYCHSCMGEGVCAWAMRAPQPQIAATRHAARIFDNSGPPPGQRWRSMPGSRCGIKGIREPTARCRTTRERGKEDDYALIGRIPVRARAVCVREGCTAAVQLYARAAYQLA